MNMSVSQNTWWRYPNPEASLAPTAAPGSLGGDAPITWNAAKRTPRSAIGSPSISIGPTSIFGPGRPEAAATVVERDVEARELARLTGVPARVISR